MYVCVCVIMKKMKMCFDLKYLLRTLWIMHVSRTKAVFSFEYMDVVNQTSTHINKLAFLIKNILLFHDFMLEEASKYCNIS